MNEGINSAYKCSPICLYRQNKVDEALREYTTTTSTNSQNSLKNYDTKKKDDKVIEFITCSYCEGSYHLDCILDNYKWHLNIHSSLVGLSFLISIQDKNIKDVEGAGVKRKHNGKTGFELNTKKKFKKSAISSEQSSLTKDTGKLSDLNDCLEQQHCKKWADYQLFEQIGYVSRHHKWACKNCIFTFALESLSHSESDSCFFDYMESKKFEVI